MALCIIFMMGRIGSVIGSNIIGVMIAHNCNLIFFIYGGLLASKYLPLNRICFIRKEKQNLIAF